MKNNKTKILFVCLGNIIRSPLGEHMMKKIVSEAELVNQYHIESAGTAGYHVGNSPDGRMRDVAAKNGLIYNGKAQQAETKHLEEFDLIIAMDQSNKHNLYAIAETQEQRDKIITMRTYDPLGNAKSDVPDPYYGGIEGFDNVFEIVKRSCQGLFESLES